MMISLRIQVDFGRNGCPVQARHETRCRHDWVSRYCILLGSGRVGLWTSLQSTADLRLESEDLPWDYARKQFHREWSSIPLTLSSRIKTYIYSFECDEYTKGIRYESSDRFWLPIALSADNTTDVYPLRLLDAIELIVGWASRHSTDPPSHADATWLIR